MLLQIGYYVSSASALLNNLLNRKTSQPTEEALKMSSNKFEALGSDDSDNEELVNNHSNQQLEVGTPWRITGRDTPITEIILVGGADRLRPSRHP